MLKYVESPMEHVPNVTPSLFLAGGISGCPDWQRHMVALLAGQDVALFNPRRADFPIHDPSAAPAQIEWEHRYLRMADAVLFWFPGETLCPIVLYELGAWSMTAKPIFVGVHPLYVRQQDVEIQTRLVRPDVTVVRSLGELAEQIKGWLAGTPAVLPRPIISMPKRG